MDKLRRALASVNQQSLRDFEGWLEHGIEPVAEAVLKKLARGAEA